jgi:hypothetical protein
MYTNESYNAVPQANPNALLMFIFNDLKKFPINKKKKKRKIYLNK